MSRVLVLFLALYLYMIPDGRDFRFSFTEKPVLEWKDFKGRPDNQSLYAALVNTGISQRFAINYEGYLIKDSVKITAYFYPELSWYKAEFATQNLLKHERGHFAISELYARKLRKKVHDYRFSSSDSRKEIDSLYDEVEKERLLMQERYDLQTMHSQNAEQEKRWGKMINTKLAALDHWASKE